MYLGSMMLIVDAPKMRLVSSSDFFEIHLIIEEVFLCALEYISTVPLPP